MLNNEHTIEQVMSKAIHVCFALPVLGASLQLNRSKARNHLGMLQDEGVVLECYDVDEIQNFCGGLDLLIHMEKFANQRRMQGIEEIAETLNRELQPVAPQQGGAPAAQPQEITEIAVKLSDDAKLNRVLRGLRNMEGLGYVPKTYDQLVIGLTDAISDELDAFFDCGARFDRDVLSHWRRAALDDWESFIGRFQLENTGQINTSRLLSITKFPLYYYLFDFKRSDDLHASELPGWDWTPLKDAINRKVEEFLQERSNELKDMITNLFIQNKPTGVNAQQYSEHVRSTLERHLASAFQSTSAAVKERLTTCASSADKLITYAEDARKEAMVMHLHNFREEFGDDVAAIQNALPDAFVRHRESGDIYDTWVDCVKRKILYRGRAAFEV